MRRLSDVETIERPVNQPRPVLRLRLTFDGGARNGSAYCGAVVTGLDGELLRHLGQSIENGTSNVGEWTGFLVGLKAALALGATHVDAYGDSELVVKQFNGEYSIKSEGLRSLALSVSQLCREFVAVTLTHVPREQNTVADSICRAIRDDRYVADAPTIDAAVGNKPVVELNLNGEITVTFTCRATMDAQVVRNARAAAVSDTTLREHFAADVERRLTMAGELGKVSIVPKRSR